MIVEKDFNIIKEEGYYILNLLKNKKELKEDSTDKYKFGGCYKQLEFALLAVVRYRKDKKYTGKEPYLQLYKDIKEYRKIKKEFIELTNSIYDSIFETKNKWIRYD